MPVNMQLLLDKLQEMKDIYEGAIRNGEYTILIRSKRLINLLHEYVIEELKNRVELSWIVRDKTVYGFPKTKEQDIIVQPPQNGRNVSVGPIMAINVRSDVPWKYEKVCLLIVDFESDPPEVIDNMQIFLDEGLVSEKFAQLYTFEDLTMKDFFDELYKVMMERYYLLGFR